MVARPHKRNGKRRGWYFDYTDPITKKRVRHYGFTTKAEAELAEKQHRLGKYTNTAPKTFTINELGTVWIKQQHHMTASALAPLIDAWTLRIQPYWGKRDISTINPLEVREWIGGLTNATTGKPLSEKTKTTTLSVLRRIIDDGITQGANITNPCVGIKIKKDPPKPLQYLSMDELLKFANAVNNPERRLLVLTLGLCGLRWGEAIALRGKHLDVKRNRIRVEASYTPKNGVETAPKGNKLRQVPVPQPLMEELVELAHKKGKNNLLWPNRNGTYLANPSINSRNWYASALERSGVEKVSPHDLRHTAASIAISNNANPKVVQQMLGHSSAAMTLDIYAGLFADDLDQVAQRIGTNLEL